MKKKAFAALLLIVITITALTAPLYAHTGRTDSNGGHYDISTGEYHYHHGYPAHQHPDGKCPYDYDDKTGSNSGSSSGTKKSSTGSKTESKTPVNSKSKAKTTSEQSSNERQFNKAGALVLFISLGVVFIAAVLLIFNKFFIKNDSLFSASMTIGYFALRTIVVAKIYFVSDNKVLVIILTSIFPAILLWSYSLHLIDYIKERRKSNSNEKT